MSQLKVNTIRHTGATSDNLSLTNTAKVGIGTDGPLKALTIKAASNTHGLYIAADNQINNGWGFQTDSSTGHLMVDRSIDNNFAYRRLTFHGDGGICFQGDTAAANALDDYEEGTFTVAMNFHGSGSSGSISLYSDQDLLSYTKIGRVVYITGRVRIETKSGGAGTDTSIGNLPFAAASATEEENAGVLHCYTYGTNLGNDNYNNPWLSVDPGGNKGYFYVTRNDDSWTPIAPSQWANGDYILVNGHYFV